MSIITESRQGASLLPHGCTPCMAKLNASRHWERTLALRIGDLLVGVRASTEDAASMLEDAFRQVREPEADERVSPNFSVELSPASERGRARLQLVYRDHQIVARRRAPHDLVRDLVEHVWSVGHPLTADHLAVHGTVLVSASSATLLPADWHRDLLMHQERLAASGLDFRPALTHLVDADRGRLVRSTAQGSTGTPASAGVPISGWVVRVPAGQEGSLRPAQGVHAVFPSVVNREAIGARSTLTGLARLAGICRLVGVGELTRGDLVEAARRFALDAQ